MCYLGMKVGVSIPALCGGGGGSGGGSLGGLLSNWAPCSARQSSMTDLSIITQRLSDSLLPGFINIASSECASDACWPL